MTNDLTKPATNNDGFDDAAADFAENVIRGELLLCRDGHWSTGQEGAALAPDTRMIALGTTTA